MTSGRSLEAVLTLGIPLHAVSMAQALERIESFIEAGKPRYVVTPNVDFAAQASRDVELHRILCEADLVLCDGMPLVWAARWVGARIRERIAGSDLLPSLLERAAGKGYRVFFLGSSQDVLEEARRRSEARYPGIQVCGAHSPPYAGVLALDHEAVGDRIRAARPDILLVAMGPPKQEKFISMNYRELGVPCSIGVGASLDFLAGRFPRAPAWMRGTGTEWLFRLLQEPRRLLPRYGDDFLFYFPALTAQLIQNRGPTPTPALLPPASPPLTGPGSWYEWRGRVDAAAVRAGEVESPVPRAPGGGVLLGLEAAASIDAVGLGMLVHAWRTCREGGGNLLLYRPSKAVQRALKAFHLDRIFQTAFTVEGAERLLALDPGVPSILATHSAGARTLRLSLGGELTARGVRRGRFTIFEQWQSHTDVERMELDLENLFFVDSAGLRLLLEVGQAVRRRRRGHLVLLRPSPNVLNVIEHGEARALLRSTMACPDCHQAVPTALD